MPENELDPIADGYSICNLADAIGNNIKLVIPWSEVDTDEQEYLDRLWSFGEGYFDMSNFDEHFGNGETGVAGA